jgi:uridylate kinase
MMVATAKPKRILLKLSGIFLAAPGESLISFERLQETVEIIASAYKQHPALQLVIVTGAGNLLRGRSTDKTLSQTAAHQIGLTSTLINALALADALTNQGAAAETLSTLHTPALVETFTIGRALRSLAEKKILVVGGGSAPPNLGVTTDTAAVVIASQLECEAVFKATNVNGVYETDPLADPQAKRYETVSFEEALTKNLQVMDQTAFALARDLDVPIVVFDFGDKTALERLLSGKNVGTLVKNVTQKTAPPT